MPPLRIGIIGTGEVAQIIHLPILCDDPDRFTVVALCDISPTTVAAVGERFDIESIHTRVEDLVQEDLDAVLILTIDEFHAEHVILALEAGLHVFVEKPLCLNLEEADAITAARDASGKAVMVGYMRRFAPAFAEAVNAVRQMERINHVRVHDVIGLNAYFVEQTAHVLRFNDLPPTLQEERTRRRTDALATALGDVPPEISGSYRMLLGLGVHDLSAMRDLVGMPTRVISASQRDGGVFQTCHFAFDGFDGHFTMGVDHQRRFDAHIEVFGDTSTVRVQWDTPYIRHLPTTWTLEVTGATGYSRTVHRPTYTDPYSCELNHFHDCIVEGKPPRTSVEDAVLDLQLSRDIALAMARELR